MRGVRFNFVKRLADSVPRQTLADIAARIAPLGWHVVIYFEAAELPQLFDFIAALPTTVVIDHMGRPDVSQPVDGPEFELFVRLMREHPQVWSKVSCAERLAATGAPDYRDVVPFARRLVESFPDRVLWGTDWPHPNLKSFMPDDGKLVDFIPRIAPTPALQQALASTAPVYYQGRPAWYYNEHWYFRSGGGWSYYRGEPGYLYNQRVVVGRPAGAYVRGGGARVVVHER